MDIIGCGKKIECDDKCHMLKRKKNHCGIMGEIPEISYEAHYLSLTDEPTVRLQPNKLVNNTRKPNRTEQQPQIKHISKDIK